MRTNAKKIEKTTLGTRMGTSWRDSFFGSLTEMIVGHKEISNLVGIATRKVRHSVCRNDSGCAEVDDLSGLRHDFLDRLLN